MEDCIPDNGVGRIGGELISDAGVFVFSECLQRLEGADIQALDRKADDASRKAADVETRADALGLILSDEQDGAGWIIGYKSWERCGTGGGTSYGGNRIVFNSAASADVKDAAKTLYSALNELGIATVTFEVSSDSRRQEVFFSGTTLQKFWQ